VGEYAARPPTHLLPPLRASRRYGLKLNNAILAGPEHAALYAELVANYPVQYTAGGATQNTIRVAQWMHGGAGFAAYAGCVGADANAAVLRKAAEGDGVAVFYDVAPDAPTGTCGVLVHKAEVRGAAGRRRAALLPPPPAQTTPAAAAAAASPPRRLAAPRSARWWRPWARRRSTPRRGTTTRPSLRRRWRAWTRCTLRAFS
jgi:hypothetical protein